MNDQFSNLEKEKLKIGACDFIGHWSLEFENYFPLTPLQVKQLYNEGSAVRFGPETGSP